MNYFLKYFLFLLWIVCSISGIAQNQIHFSGTIFNYPESKFKIWKIDKAHDEQDFQIVKIKDGNFSVVINSGEPTGLRCFFKGKEIEFFAIPGDSLVLTADYNKLEATTRFEGKGNVTSQFNSLRKQKFRVSHKAELENRKNYTPERYLEFRKNLLDSELAFLHDYADKNGIKESPFLNYYVTVFKFSFYSNLCVYIMDHIDIEKDGVRPEYLPLLKILDEIDYNDPNFVETCEYRWYLMYYINNIKYRQLIYEKALPQVSKDSVPWFYRTYGLSKKLLKENLHESYVMTLLYEFLNPITVGYFVPIYDHFIQTCSQENRLILEDSFTKYKSLSKNHKLSGNSQIKKTDGGLKEILPQYKGSVLYVDFWASWCAPCIDEMSYSKEIQKKFNDKQVKFLFISVDQDEDSWKKAISLHKIPGIHFRLDKEHSADLLKNLLSKGIPHYMIVGKDGKTMDSEAKRPSDPQLVSDIEKLLNN